MQVVDDMAALVAANLLRLRKNLGMRNRDLDQRIDPEFCELFGASGDDVDAMRQKLTAYLEELVTRLPAELQIAARHGLNIGSDAADVNLTDRIDDLAESLVCDARTARRRIDKAFGTLAEHAASGSTLLSGAGHGGSGWYIDSFDVVLRLDQETPVAYERRRILVTAQTLDEIATSIDVPRHPGQDERIELHTDIWFGGLLAGRLQESTTNFQTTVRLPKRLRKHERHTLGLIHRIPPGQRMAPRYVYVPYRSCRHFRVVVRFAPDLRPIRVWRHDGVPHSVVADGVPSSHLLALDLANETCAEFVDLVGGLSYGVQWEFS
ncbi:hypothetical protein SK854_25435 [Lentzea sp. BCCO 10_0061]|uniref:Uncharacterized protein n=1 Tax=Lentzea sokolovensis TaxID=3095429 RepID=A0ABU4V127_9PSEU|nr:hypothetical protein [Lentzea sp. BCCO 10_0061]MDX8145478.1 hypothetical protein [Lentzea sp. BCCO 10_0061]